MSPYTIYEVVNMVIAAGGIPVFADIDASTCNIDYKAVARLIDEETGAVMVTHLHGLACNVSAFLTLCKKSNIPLIEDCAQAFGAVVDGRRAGTIGDAGVYSFSMRKNVNCLYGGALVSSDDGLQHSCREFLTTLPMERWHRLGKRAFASLFGDIANSRLLFSKITFPYLRWKINRGGETALRAVAFEHRPVRRDVLPRHYLRRITPLQARVVTRQLTDVDRQTDIRIGYAREYHSMLTDLPQITLSPLREDRSHTYLDFPIQVSDRYAFQRELMAKGCDARLQSYTNLANASCYAEFNRACPAAEQVAGRTIRLPMYTMLGLNEVRRIGSIIKSLMPL
jgi:dTDP-4-amino-4,6-dideoxygalactose transaminase